MNRVLMMACSGLLLAACDGAPQAGPDAGGKTLATACAAYATGIVTPSEAGNGCELEQAVGTVTETCSVTDPDNAADKDSESFAALLAMAVGLDPAAEFGDAATQVGLTVDLSGTQKAGAFAGFDLQMVSDRDFSLLHSITIETLNNGAATGDSVDIVADDFSYPGELGGFANGSDRMVAGLTTTADYNQIRINFGADFGHLDGNDTLHVFGTCTGI